MRIHRGVSIDLYIYTDNMSVGCGVWWRCCERANSMSDIAEKWGEAVAGRGFAQIPNYLLLLNQFLDAEQRLSPVELLILFQLVGNWWRKGELPFPSMGTLATRCGVSDRQIQRAVNHLQELGLLQRVNRRKKGIIASNAYDLSPLVQILNEIARTFPNEFPRAVDRVQVRKLTEQLAAKEGSDEAPPLALGWASQA
jgi:DNA-binding transcriptional regulator YhcF (GntR family)